MKLRYSFSKKRENQMGISQSILEKKICDQIVDIAKNPEWINVHQDIYEKLRKAVELYYSSGLCSVLKMGLQNVLCEMNRELNQSRLLMGASFGAACPTLINQIANLIRLADNLEKTRNKKKLV